MPIGRSHYEPGENQETDDGKNASPCLTQKAPYKGLGADSEEKREPASVTYTAVVVIESA
jgi:hypothetical protein